MYFTEMLVLTNNSNISAIHYVISYINVRFDFYCKIGTLRHLHLRYMMCKKIKGISKPVPLPFAL